MELVTSTPRVTRNPERTRELLLQAAFDEIHQSGFRGSDLNSILNVAGVTKGALYHHFSNKEALGYAVVEERIAGSMRNKWLVPLENGDDPIATLQAILDSESIVPEDVERGCPLNNLAQEMSPLDEGFRARLASVFKAWHVGITMALARGQNRGCVRRDLKPNDIAWFYIAAYEGFVSLSKNSREAGFWAAGKQMLKGYLDSLRPTGDVA